MNIIKTKWLAVGGLALSLILPSGCSKPQPVAYVDVPSQNAPNPNYDPNYNPGMVQQQPPPQVNVYNPGSSASNDDWLWLYYMSLNSPRYGNSYYYSSDPYIYRHMHHYWNDYHQAPPPMDYYSPRYYSRHYNVSPSYSYPRYHSYQYSSTPPRSSTYGSSSGNIMRYSWGSNSRPSTSTYSDSSHFSSGYHRYSSPSYSHSYSSPSYSHSYGGGFHSSFSHR